MVDVTYYICDQTNQYINSYSLVGPIANCRPLHHFHGPLMSHNLNSNGPYIQTIKPLDIFLIHPTPQLHPIPCTLDERCEFVQRFNISTDFNHILLIKLGSHRLCGGPRHLWWMQKGRKGIQQTDNFYEDYWMEVRSVKIAIMTTRKLHMIQRLTCVSLYVQYLNKSYNFMYDTIITQRK